MTDHAPGPWEAHRYGAHGSLSIRRAGKIPAGERYRIAGVGTGRYRDPQDEANARLMAAAPDMLAALEKIKANIESPAGSDTAIHYAATEAIAKAKAAEIKEDQL